MIEVEGEYLQVCQHDWQEWDEGEHRQYRRCHDCGSEEWRDSLIPKPIRSRLA